MKYPNGTKLTGEAKHSLPKGLTLEDTEFLTEAGSCGEDQWLYHWADARGVPFLTTDIELAGYLADGATLSY